MHFCCSHYISPCFLSIPPLSFPLSLSLSLSLSLWLQDTCHLMPFTKYPLLNQSYFFHTISFHSSYKIHQLFTDYLLQLPSSELLEKHLFRSRANRRLVQSLSKEAAMKSRSEDVDIPTASAIKENHTKQSQKESQNSNLGELQETHPGCCPLTTGTLPAARVCSVGFKH